MLRLKVQETAKARGVNNPVELASVAKVAYATAYRLWQGQLGTEGRGVGVLALHKVSRALGVKLWELIEETEMGNTKPALGRS